MKHTSTAAIPNQTPATVAKSTPDIQEQIRRRAYGLYESLKALHDAPLPAPLERYPQEAPPSVNQV